MGVAFGPRAANWIRPLQYARGSQLNLDAITLYFSRLVLGVQLVLAGIQLPSRYLRTEWKSLSLLLGLGMCAMWISSSLLVWALVPQFTFLHALGVGACLTPTDPVLSNNIVKGKFADKNIPKELQRIIIGESGANDGLGYPFLFLSLYLVRYVGDSGLGQSGGASKALGYWFGITWGYEIALSVIWGAFVGWLFQVMLHWAESRKYVDRESFLIFAISIALFIVGTIGMVGSDDVLACFIAGNTFTWEYVSSYSALREAANHASDWFRLETEDDSFQPTIDLLLNVSIFAWYGAICPWDQFVHNRVVSISRLIPLGILILLLRRIPIIFLMRKKIHQIEDIRQASFMGFFGPVGVSAIFYLYTSLDYLGDIQINGHQREDAAQMAEVMTIVVWFMTICSIVVHGLTIPLGKLGIYLPRTVSRALSTERPSESDEPEHFHMREQATGEEHALEAGSRKLPTRGDGRWPQRMEAFGRGRAIMQSSESSPVSHHNRSNNDAEQPSRSPPGAAAGAELQRLDHVQIAEGRMRRAIQFPDQD